MYSEDGSCAPSSVAIAVAAMECLSTYLRHSSLSGWFTPTRSSAYTPAIASHTSAGRGRSLSAATSPSVSWRPFQRCAAASTCDSALARSGSGATAATSEKVCTTSAPKSAKFAPSSASAAMTSRPVHTAWSERLAPSGSTSGSGGSCAAAAAATAPPPSAGGFASQSATAFLTSTMSRSSSSPSSCFTWKSSSPSFSSAGSQPTTFPYETTPRPKLLRTRAPIH